MGNLTTGFRKFLQNKNTVTVVGIILGILVIYVAYTMRIKAEINPMLRAEVLTVEQMLKLCDVLNETK